MRKVLLVLPVLVLAGCFSIDRGTSAAFRNSRLNITDGEPMEHVLVANYGWYLFDCIPIVCGNAKPGASFPFRVFSDNVKADIMQDRLMNYAAMKNADLVDLHYFHNSNVLFTIPGLSVPVPIPYVLCYREIQFSGVLVKPPVLPPPARQEPAALAGEMQQLLNQIGGDK